MQKITLLISFILILSLNFLGQENGFPNKELFQEQISAEEYKLWSDNWCSETEVEPLQVIKNETLNINISLDEGSKINRIVKNYYAENKLADVTKDLITDFNLKNSHSYLIDKKILKCERIVLVTKTDLESVYGKSKDNEERWKAFNIKYPNTWNLQFLARIGFSPDKKQALAYYQYYCGFLCASGYYLFYVKKNGVWIEESEINVWNS
jgi:hypothetical protein